MRTLCSKCHAFFTEYPNTLCRYCIEAQRAVVARERTEGAFERGEFLTASDRRTLDEMLVRW